jgi:DNA-binding LytR/AlgR family response regulator
MKTYQHRGNETLLTINQKNFTKVLVNQVILLKGESNYTTFYMHNGKKKLVARTIKFFENHLENLGFLRVHRSCLINPNYVIDYNHVDETLMMSNGFQATIARRRRAVLKKL